MLPDSLAAAHFHESTTGALVDLLEVAVSVIDGSCLFERRVELGRYRAKVRSNSEEAGEFFSHCLMDAHSSRRGQEAIELLVICGNVPPYSVAPGWNFPHSDARHLERLHLSPDGRISAFYDHDRAFWFILDQQKRVATFWIADWSEVPFWERAAPFKSVINWFLHDKRDVLLHSAVVTKGSKALLLSGPGGSGKSTTVAACVEQGLGTTGDDLVLLGDNDGTWKSQRLYNSLKLTPEADRFKFRRLQQVNSLPCGAKRIIRYTDVNPDQFSESVTLCGLAHCVLSGQSDTRIVETRPSDIMRFLAPPTVFLLRGREAHILAKCARLVRDLPCFRIELGNSPQEAAKTIGNWLDGTAA